MIASSNALATPELLVDLKVDIDPTLLGCPSVAEFRNIVGQQLGYDPYRADAPLRVQIRAQAVEHGIEGAINWNDSTDKRVGERQFSSRNRDCHELMVTMGFVVAVQIQLLAVDQTTGPTPTPQPANAELADSSSSQRSETVAVRTVPTPQGEAPPPAQPPESARPSEPWLAMAGMGPSVGYRLGPSLIAQGRLFVAIQHARASLELAAEASLPSTTDQDDGGGFRHSLVLGTIAVCGHHRFASACGLGKAGQIKVRGEGVDVPASPTGFIAQAGPRLAATLALGDHWVLLTHAEALVLLTPWTVELRHTAVWKMPRVGAVAGIDLAFRFR
jgi:hypothetical protein